MVSSPAMLEGTAGDWDRASRSLGLACSSVISGQLSAIRRQHALDLFLCFCQPAPTRIDCLRKRFVAVDGYHDFGIQRSERLNIGSQITSNDIYEIVRRMLVS